MSHEPSSQNKSGQNESGQNKVNGRRLLSLAVLVLVLGLVGWSLTRNRSHATDTTSAVSATSGAGSDAATAITAGSASAPPSTAVAADLPNLGPHQELVGIDGWLQSDIDSLDQLDGQVYAVQFWTFGCYNCKNTLPHLQELYAKYRDQGFQIVGVHSPEFDYEADPANITQAAKDLGVTWPIALDPQKKSFWAWQNGHGVWPRIYIIDRNGNVRLDHKGEGAYKAIDEAVGALLAEPA